MALKGVVLPSKIGYGTRVNQLNPAWYYNWSVGDKLDKVMTTIQFIPMWRNLGAFGASPPTDAVAVLGPNEPDGSKTGQANASPRAVANAWGRLAALKWPVGSPAVSGSNDGDIWFRQFMAMLAPADRLDFICLHWYGGPDPNQLAAKLDQLRGAYNKPIWLTEFAVRSTRLNTYTPEQALLFLKQAIDLFNKRPWLARYCWCDNCADAKPEEQACSQLWDSAGKLTDLGAYYAALPSGK